MTKAAAISIKLGFEQDLMGVLTSEKDNQELHELLNDECVSFKEVMQQDAWVFEDGSYITRSVDDYFIGDDIDMFEIEEELS